MLDKRVTVDSFDVSDPMMSFAYYIISNVLKYKIRREHQAISHWPWGAHLTIHSLFIRIVSFLESVIEFYKKGSQRAGSGKVILILQFILKVRRLVTLLLYLARDYFRKEYVPMWFFFNLKIPVTLQR